jgi:hypothetical protein
MPFAFLLMACTPGATFFLDQSSGSPVGDGLTRAAAFDEASRAVRALAPGDTLRVVNSLANPTYDPTYTFRGDPEDAYIWKTREHTLHLAGVKGTAAAPITITGCSGTILRGDASSVVRVSDCAHLRLVNLTIEGEVERIPLSTAQALQFLYIDQFGRVQRRVPAGLTNEEIAALKLPLIGEVQRPSYTNTRGVYVSGSHHVTIEGCAIRWMPAHGILIADTRYVDVVRNEVSGCTRKSYAGVDAIVLTKIRDSRPRDGAVYRARVVGNLVHGNYNEIYSWVGTKPFVTPRIDEGKGIALHRNTGFPHGGRMLVASNIGFRNGYSAILLHDTDNADVFSNTAYLSSHTKSVTYMNSTDQPGLNIGISAHNTIGCRIVNNIAVVDGTLSSGFAFAVSRPTEMLFDSNLQFAIGGRTRVDKDLAGIASNTLTADPLLGGGGSTRPNLELQAIGHVPLDSPAAGRANGGFAPCQDYYGQQRVDTLGAVEATDEAAPGDGVLPISGLDCLLRKM